MINEDIIHTLNLEELDNVAGGTDGTQAKYRLEYGSVVEILPNSYVRVQLDNGELIKVSMSGQLRSRCIKIIVGDRAEVQIWTNGSGARLTNVSWHNAF